MSEAIELGSGRLADLGIAAKAARVDAAKAAGLPVPDGMVVPDGADGARAAATITARFTRPLAVRSAFSAEDTGQSSMAGHFHTELHVEPNVSAITAAVAAVRESGPGEIRRDVLVMKMIDARHAGVAFSEPGFEDDLVNVVSGQGSQLVSGAESGERIQLARLRRFEGTNGDDDWARRLQELLREVRQVEGDEPWDIEWADDGTTCWFLQIRPITAPTTRDELFTLANHREILPDPPSVFMSSVIMSNGRRLQGPGGMLAEATARRGYFEMFDGRPYINQSVTTDLVRGLGLPSALVNESLGGDDLDDVRLNPLRIALSLPTLARLGLDQAQAVGRSKRVAARLAQPNPKPRTFTDAIESFADDHLALVEEMGNLVSAMAVPLAVLRKLGVLDAHFGALETPGTRIMSDLRSIAQRAASSPEARAALVGGQIPEDVGIRRLWDQWLDDHGHRGRFESDIAEPRFHEIPQSTLKLAATLPTGARERTSDSGWRVRVTTPLWIMGRRALVAREELRTQAMRGFDVHRAGLLRLARTAVADGRLPESTAIWHMTVDELRALDAGDRITFEWLTERRAEIAAHAAIDVPEVRRRFGTVDASAPPDGSGIPLYPGTVEGRAWVLTSPSTELPDGFDPATTILVARSVDAGWVPTFGLVTGVAVDIGGDLSHGSIILRELAMPAITNTRGMTRQISTGDHVVLDAQAGKIRQRAV